MASPEDLNINFNVCFLLALTTKLFTAAAVVAAAASPED